MRYKVLMEIKSEAILGSGVSNLLIHEDSLYDDHGFIYYSGKTLKGVLRKTAKTVYDNDEEIIRTLFGEENKTEEEVGFRGNNEKLIFTDLSIPKSTKEKLKKYGLNKNEILKTQTNIRQFIKIGENFVTKKGSLRNFRTIKDGIVLIGEIQVDDDFKFEKELLFILKATRNLGLSRNRGRGEVEFKLFDENNGNVEVKYNEIKGESCLG